MYTILAEKHREEGVKQLEGAIFQVGCAEVLDAKLFLLINQACHLMGLLGVLQLIRAICNMFFCRSVSSILWSMEPLQPSPAWVLGFGGTSGVLPDFELIHKKKEDRLKRKLPKLPKPEKYFMADSSEREDMEKQRELDLQNIEKNA